MAARSAVSTAAGSAETVMRHVLMEKELKYPPQHLPTAVHVLGRGLGQLVQPIANMVNQRRLGELRDFKTMHIDARPAAYCRKSGVR
jgi:hypothetical protein